MDELHDFHWLAPRNAAGELDVNGTTRCYLEKPETADIDFIVHQRVPYLADYESMNDVAMMLLQNDTFTEEFFEDMMNMDEETLKQNGLLEAKEAALECDAEPEEEHEKLDPGQDHHAEVNPATPTVGAVANVEQQPEEKKKMK